MSRSIHRPVPLLLQMMSVLWSLHGFEMAIGQEPPEILTVPIVTYVARDAFFDVVSATDSAATDGAQLARLLESVHAIYAAAGVRIQIAPPRELLMPDAHLKGVKDRNALARLVPRIPGVIEIFVVASTGDVDRKDEEVAGVHWRYQGPSKNNRGRRYIILSGQAARPDTLAHELGHWFGLGHVTDPANLMFPGGKREGQALSDKQSDQIRATLKKALRDGELKAPSSAAQGNPGSRLR